MFNKYQCPARLYFLLSFSSLIRNRTIDLRFPVNKYQYSPRLLTRLFPLIPRIAVRFHLERFTVNVASFFHLQKGLIHSASLNQTKKPRGDRGLSSLCRLVVVREFFGKNCDLARFSDAGAFRHYIRVIREGHVDNTAFKSGHRFHSKRYVTGFNLISEAEG